MNDSCLQMMKGHVRLRELKIKHSRSSTWGVAESEFEPRCSDLQPRCSHSPLPLWKIYRHSVKVGMT